MTHTTSMRRTAGRIIMLYILVLGFSARGYAADFLDGYIVMANKDTVQCRFKSGGFFRSISFKRIEVTTAEGEKQVYRADDKKILGFGVVERGIRYDFIYVELKPRSESGFYQRIVDGGKYKLYVHTVVSQGYPGVSTAQPQYVLFNPAGEFRKFETCVLCSWKKQLRELLKDDEKALALLETASRLEIPKFVLAINNN